MSLPNGLHLNDFSPKCLPLRCSVWVSVLWSHLEWQFEDCIRMLSGTSKDRARIMTQGMPLRSRIMTVRALLQERGLINTLSAQFEPIAKEITEKDVESQRNTVVHSLWHQDKNTKQWYAVITAGSWFSGKRLGRIRRSVLPESTPMGRPQLVTLSNRIILLMTQMNGFRRAVKSGLSASPKKS